MRNPRKLKNGGKEIEKREERIRGGQSRGKVNKIFVLVKCLYILLSDPLCWFLIFTLCGRLNH